MDDLYSVISCIFKKHIDRPKIDLKNDFVGIGGNSLTLLLIMMELSEEYGIELDYELFFNNNDIDSIIRIIVKNIRLVENHDIKEEQLNIIDYDNIPILPNRFRYFLKRKYNLNIWNIWTPILQVDERINYEILCNVITELINKHDVLKLRANIDDYKLNQYLKKDSSKKYIHFLRNDDELTVDELKVHAKKLHSGFDMSNPLMKVLFIEQPKTKYIHIVLHHLLIDAYSFQLIIKDFFNICENFLSDHKELKFLEKFNYYDYAHSYINHMKTNEAKYFDYWKSQSREPHSIPLIKGEKVSNSDEYTVSILKEIEISENSSESFNIGELVITAIAAAYRKWLQCNYLFIDVVYHGRAGIENKMNLANTSGWISEAIPINLPISTNIKQMVSVKENMKSASTIGSSFGYLKYISENNAIREYMESFPEPEISFNYIHSKKRNLYKSQIIKSNSELGMVQVPPPRTERAYLICGGGWVEDGKIVIAWDFSKYMVEFAEMEKFSNLCIEELKLLI